jgi:transcriptional antiterminator Rof (Rho-off)
VTVASEQQVIGQCAAIDVFEEAVTRRSAVKVRLHGGVEFTAHVEDVVTEGGVNYVVFRGRGRVAVGEIAQAARGAG